MGEWGHKQEENLLKFALKTSKPSGVGKFSQIIRTLVIKTGIPNLFEASDLEERSPYTTEVISLQSVNVYAGVEVGRDGVASPTATGRLCEWKQDPAQPANSFNSFGAYQRSLTLDCQAGQPGILQWTPDRNTPDTVYYQVNITLMFLFDNNKSLSVLIC